MAQMVALSVEFRPWMKPAINVVADIAWALSLVGIKPDWANRPAAWIAKKAMVCRTASFDESATPYQPGAPVVPGKTYLVTVGDRL